MFGLLLRHRPHFRRLWIADIISYLGDWLSYIAVAVLAVREGGSALAVAMVMVGHSLPHALMAPLAGPLADRLDRRRLMIITNLLRSVLTLAMGAAAWAGHIALLQGLLLLRTSVGAFFLPARSAALPRSLKAPGESGPPTPELLVAAHTLSSATWSVMFSVGVAAGGVASELLGPVSAIILDAATFLFASAVLIRLPSLPPERPEGETARPLGPRDVLRELGQAWRFAAERPALRTAVLAKTPLAIAAGGGWLLINLLADDLVVPGWLSALGGGALGLGAIHAARGVGTGLGPVFNRWLERRELVPSATLWKATGWLMFAALLALPLVGRGILPVTLVAFVWGAGVGANWVTSSARQQTLAPDHLLGRLSALDFLSFTVAQTLTGIAGALIVDAGADRSAAVLVGLVLGPIAWLGLFRGPSTRRGAALSHSTAG